MDNIGGKRIAFSPPTAEIKKSKYHGYNFLLSTYKKMYDEKILTDFVLTAAKDGTQFETHKSVLAATCGYFSGLFKPNFADSNGQEHVVDFVDGPALEKIVQFCYTGEIALDEKDVGDILRAANLLCFDYIERKCAAYLRRKLNLNNCVPRYMLARHEELGLLELKADAFEFICVNFKSFTEAQLHQVDKELMEEILQSENIQASEDNVFLKLISWAECNGGERFQFVPGLMKKIQLHRIDGKFLLETVKPTAKKFSAPFMLLITREIERRALEYVPTSPPQRYVPVQANFPHGVQIRRGSYVYESSPSVSSTDGEHIQMLY